MKLIHFKIKGEIVSSPFLFILFQPFYSLLINFWPLFLLQPTGGKWLQAMFRFSLYYFFKRWDLLRVRGVAHPETLVVTRIAMLILVAKWFLNLKPEDFETFPHLLPFSKRKFSWFAGKESYKLWVKLLVRHLVPLFRGLSVYHAGSLRLH